MIILRASHLGMCFGVRDAIQLARREAASGPVTVLGDLVHNSQVLHDLESQGIRIERRLENVHTPTVLITAHGASDRRLQEVQSRGHRMIEATCPLVRFAHARVQALVAAGYHPVIIGQKDHVEVRGLTEDFPEHDVILDDLDISRLPARKRYGVAAQTTQPMPRVQRLLDLLRQHFPEAEIAFADTVCRPTKERQSAAERLATECDVVIVIGGAHSNNTRELVATCLRHCRRVHHVQTAADLRRDWFQPADIVGITAGTSTPDAAIEGVEAALQRWNDSTDSPHRWPSSKHAADRVLQEVP